MKCTSCLVEKSSSHFSKRGSRPRGAASRCNTCLARDQRSYSNRMAEIHDDLFYAELNWSQEKSCKACSSLKPYSDFGKNRRMADGLNFYCRSCRKAQRNPVVDQAANKRWRINNPSRKMLSQARRNAAARGEQCELTLEDIIIPKLCPVLGIPIVETTGSGGRSDGTATLDRINNDIGYLKGNVIVVSWRANRLKSNSTPKELRRIADFYEGLVQ